jgi:hypothetical protein
MLDCDERIAAANLQAHTARMEANALEAHRRGWTWEQFEKRYPRMIPCDSPREFADVTSALVRLINLVHFGTLPPA